MRRLIPLLVLPLLLATACADPNAEPPAGGDSYRPGDLVLRVEVSGGFVPPPVLLERVPVFTLYGDGRVISPGPQIAIYPSPALPSVTIRTIAPAAIGQLVQLAIDAGVGSGADFGVPSVADVPSTVFTVVSNGVVRRSSVEALGFDNGLSPAQVAARQKLTTLMEKLTDLPGTIGADKAGTESAYEPTIMAVLPRLWSAPQLETPEQESRPWPGPELPGPPVPGNPGPLVTCLALTGSELSAVLASASTANALTPWESNGQRYTVSFRPLLPDELTCADLAHD